MGFRTFVVIKSKGVRDRSGSQMRGNSHFTVRKRRLRRSSGGVVRYTEHRILGYTEVGRGGRSAWSAYRVRTGASSEGQAGPRGWGHTSVRADGPTAPAQRQDVLGGDWYSRPPTPARSCRGAGVAGSDSSTATADGSCGRFGTLLGKLYPRVSFSSETVLCLLTSQGLPEESKGLEEKS